MVYQQAKQTPSIPSKTFQQSGRRSPLGPALVLIMLTSTWTGMVIGTEPVGAQEAGLTTPGLLAEYFHDQNLAEPAFERIDRVPGPHWDGGDRFSARWTGYFTPASSGEHIFHLRTWSRNDARLYLNDNLVLQTTGGRGESLSLILTAGEPMAFLLEYKKESLNMLDLQLQEPGHLIARSVHPARYSTDLGLLATYHTGQTLSSPVDRHVEGPIDHDWGSGGPASVGSDDFSVRWTGAVTAPTTGAYTFHTRSDDGARVSIAGHTIIDDWNVHAATEDQPSNLVHLTAGVAAQIVVDYFEAAGGASMQLKWSGPEVPLEIVPTSALRPALQVMKAPGIPPAIDPHDTVLGRALRGGGTIVSYAAPGGAEPVTCTPASASVFTFGTTPVTCTATDTRGRQATTQFAVHVDPVHGLLGQYRQLDKTGQPAFERIDARPTFDWGFEAPDPRLDPDLFAVRWTGYITAPTTGEYTLHATADDTVQVFLDNNRIIDARIPPCCREVSSDPIVLTKGVATPIRIDYAERFGEAGITLKWSALGIPQQVVPASAFSTDAGLLATYYNRPSLWGPSTSTVEASIDHEWEPGVLADRSGARWTGFVTAPTTGEYTFYTRNDDGARVWIAGDLVIDDWLVGAAHEDKPSSPVHLARGVPTQIQVEYFQSLGSAAMQLRWSGPDVPKQIVPTTALAPALGPDLVAPIQVEAGFFNTCALHGSGNIDCWGDNGLGQSANYTGGDAIAVAVGGLHTCALLQDGNIDCWGDNTKGQSTDYTGGDAIWLAAGVRHTCALRQDGNIDCWGDNTDGESDDYSGGDGVQVAAGWLHTCALLQNGNIDCWGADFNGQAADYTGGDATHVTAGEYHTCALLQNGNIDCWGHNGYGQSADYTGGDAIAVAAGEYHTCALLESGNIDCWGADFNGQAADHTRGDAIHVAAGRGHTCALLESGTILCWGSNAQEQLNAPIDMIPPRIDPLDTIVAEATGPDGAVVDYAAPTADFPVMCTPEPRAAYAVGTHQVTCTTSDLWGNVARTFFAIRVLPDITPPLTTIQATGTHGENGWYVSPINVTLSCEDTGWGCDGSYYMLDGGVLHRGDGLTVFQQGTTVLQEFYSIDGRGNREGPQTEAFMVDTEPPLIEPHDDETYEATGPSGADAPYTPPRWTDAAVGEGSATCTPAAGTGFPLGDTAVTCTTQDPAGHQAAPTTFTVSVVDTTAPLIAAHPDVVEEATGPQGNVVLYNAPSWTDAVTGSGASTCTPTSNTTFALGNTTVTCTAPADDAGNEPTPTTFVVSIMDTTPPAIEAHPDLVQEATGPEGTNVTYMAPEWTDAVDGNGTSVCTPSSNATFAVGNTTVTCTTTDAAGNTGSQTFTVSVVDTTPPRIEEHADEVHEATGPTGANVTYLAPRWTDIVDGTGNSTCAPASATMYGLGNATVLCSATDAAGNQATSTFNITVQDTTPPVIEPKADETMEATAYGGATINYTAPTWHDLVDGNGTATCAPERGTFQPMGTTTVTCSATDAANNSANATTFQVTVIPGPVADVIVSPTNLTLNLAQPGNLTANGFDQYGNPTDGAPAWAAENGTIDPHGVYVGHAVGQWQVNATIDNVTGNATVNVTDVLRLGVVMDSPVVSPLAALGKGVHGTLNVTFWDHSPLGNATIEVVVTHTAADVDLRSTILTATSGPDGMARFQVPDEFTLVGDYRVDAAATWSGNRGEARTGYTVGA